MSERLTGEQSEAIITVFKEVIRQKNTVDGIRNSLLKLLLVVDSETAKYIDFLRQELDDLSNRLKASPTETFEVYLASSVPGLFLDLAKFNAIDKKDLSDLERRTLNGKRFLYFIVSLGAFDLSLYAMALFNDLGVGVNNPNWLDHSLFWSPVTVFLIGWLRLTQAYFKKIKEIRRNFETTLKVLEDFSVAELRVVDTSYLETLGDLHGLGTVVIS